MKEEKLNAKLNTGIAEIRKIKMTREERGRALENILHSPALPIPSPWGFSSFIILIQKNNRLLSYIVASCLILILGGGGAVYASFDSLPGSALYPLKVNIVEPISYSLTFSLEGKAEYESTLAMMRLIEAETLADRGELDAEKEKILTDLLEIHTSSLERNLGKIKPSENEEDEERNNKIITNFHSGMNAHARLLDIIRAGEENAEENNEKIQNTAISKSAQANASKIKNSFKKESIEENDDVKIQNRYAKKKNAVQSIIDRTSKNLDLNINNESRGRKRIIDDTNKTLEEAKRFLKEAEEKEKKGERVNAYSKLLDSEVTAREADIFLQSGLKLKWKNSRK
ncbi:hypothetical protein A3A95_04430 [Candidatus Nomurabacteria bacterium RIFCSPLOWO2_01_FULL_39_18]|uniref:DUF5667 domain-containing protein n=1 Tax=Candidatus Nomurabacteria bacterium RIFCSPHIGHO2_01_FULL_40_24b TaxID=1801739 RepID=A0A1F6V6L6_9BACT|nr:MAG: hypothetical protein A2647_04095 [Candidatus Nomurabacteria bacterium RIFCSPHIGHO2_01_FULL_40_24b]OGI89343.1 MAG: hypothetical protein A3A95_04430 [Candidatus Nomurabacteria bacterium RIFCSPLOWO2_01_FULL_39_18]